MGGVLMWGAEISVLKCTVGIKKQPTRAVFYAYL